MRSRSPPAAARRAGRWSSLQRISVYASGNEGFPRSTVRDNAAAKAWDDAGRELPGARSRLIAVPPACTDLRKGAPSSQGDRRVLEPAPDWANPLPTTGGGIAL